MSTPSILFCRDCGRATTQLEAESRLFNTGKCAECNGELSIYQPVATAVLRTHTRDGF